MERTDREKVRAGSARTSLSYLSVSALGLQKFRFRTFDIDLNVSAQFSESAGITPFNEYRFYLALGKIFPSLFLHPHRQKSPAQQYPQLHTKVVEWKI